MKVLFLDIDGVLNSENWFAYRIYCVKNNMVNILMNFVDTDDRNIKHKLTMLDDRAIANLNRIIEETGCKVVLSSSWRSPIESENIFTQDLLKLKGFKYEFYDVTPRLWFSDFSIRRGEEIKFWLDKESEKHEIESFVILDDDSDMLPEQMNNFIHIDGQVGLTDRDVLTAIEILNR